MKFKEYLATITTSDGFVPTPLFRRIIQKNKRPTAREEAIAASILEQANPRENISGHAGWDKEETLVLQQFLVNPNKLHIGPEHPDAEWRDVPTLDKHLYTVEDTKYGPMPVPNAVKQPGEVPMDLHAKISEALGEEDDLDNL